jgi:hypothetical protein
MPATQAAVGEGGAVPEERATVDAVESCGGGGGRVAAAQKSCGGGEGREPLTPPLGHGRRPLVSTLFPSTSLSL